MNFSIISLLCLLFLTESFTDLPALTQILLLSWDLYSVQSTCSPSSPCPLPLPLSHMYPSHPHPETGWALGPFAVMLQCLHLDTPLLEQQNTKKLYGTKNNCAFSLRANSGQKMQRDQKNQLLLLKLLEQKQVTEQAPLHRTPPKGKRPSHPSSSTPRHIPIPTPYKEQACPHRGE